MRSLLPWQDVFFRSNRHAQHYVLLLYFAHEDRGKNIFFNFRRSSCILLHAAFESPVDKHMRSRPSRPSACLIQKHTMASREHHQCTKWFSSRRYDGPDTILGGAREADTNAFADPPPRRLSPTCWPPFRFLGSPAVISHSSSLLPNLASDTWTREQQPLGSRWEQGRVLLSHYIAWICGERGRENENRAIHTTFTADSSPNPGGRNCVRRSSC